MQGTGDGGPSRTAWTPADVFQMVMGVGLLIITTLLVGAVMVVRQEDVRTILTALLGTGLGAIGGVITGRTMGQHTTQAGGTNVEQAENVIDASGGQVR